MNKRKRPLLLPVLALALCLSACGAQPAPPEYAPLEPPASQEPAPTAEPAPEPTSEPEPEPKPTPEPLGTGLAGLWEGDWDLTDSLTESVQSGAGEEAPAFAAYLDGPLTIRLRLRLDEGGLCRIAAEEESVGELIGRFSAAAGSYVRDCVFLEARAYLESKGEDVSAVESPEDLEPYFNRSFDELLEEALGMDLDSYLAMVLPEEQIKTRLALFERELSYEDSGSELRLSDGTVWRYTLDGNSLLLEGEDSAGLLPMTLRRIG